MAKNPEMWFKRGSKPTLKGWEAGAIEEDNTVFFHLFKKENNL